MVNPKPADKIKVILRRNKKEIEGILMPRAKLFSDDMLVLKLSNGYNIGIEKKSIAEIRLIEKYKERGGNEEEEIKIKQSLPTISILHTGGTIASKVDYRTGAVVAKFSPEEIIKMFPELTEIANIQSRLVFQMFSEDIEPEHWGILAKEISEEIKKGINGILITHGTDTLSYTSSALSFMLRDLPVPVILVGSQRSSDRGSSDAYLNIISAARFIANTDFAGVAVCMHATSSDICCYIHHGTNVRKMHSSSRDAFKSVNTIPIAKVFVDGNIEFLVEEYGKRDKKSLILMNNFDRKIGGVKIRPGISYNELNFFEKRGYRGLVLEGTGLGHAPVNVLDKYTRHHKKILSTLKRMSKTILVVMTTQCIYGDVNMNVYSTGRDILYDVIIPANMIPETAYV